MTATLAVVLTAALAVATYAAAGPDGGGLAGWGVGLAVAGLVALMAAGQGRALIGLLGGGGLGLVPAGLRDGGSPGRLAAGVLALGGAVALVVLVLRHERKQRRIARLMEDGAEAIGTVLAAPDPGDPETVRIGVRLRFRIEPVERVLPPYEAEKVVTMRGKHVPRVGDRLPVWFDPADTSRWAFAAAVADPVAVDPRAKSLWDLGRNGVRPPYPKPLETDADVIDELVALDDLRARGELDQETFAARATALLRERRPSRGDA